MSGIKTRFDFKYLNTAYQFYHKFTNKLLDQFLIFQFNVCNSDTKQLLPNGYSFFLLVSITLESWWPLATYIFLMAFCVVTVTLGKLFPKVIGIPLTRFYKRYATPKVFKEYCGNLFSEIVGGAIKVFGTGTGRVAIATAGAILTQDAAHKAGIGQYPKYVFEKWANGGSHPSSKPFVFKENGPSWADNISNWGKPD